MNKDDPEAKKDAPAPIGARQENSSLFSLEALKKQEQLALDAEPKRTEDSGIIDLKALALIQKSEKSDAGKSIDVARVQAPDIFQIGMVSQLSAPQPIALAAPPTAEAPPPKARTLPIVIGVVAIAAVGGVAFFLGRGSGPQPATQQAATVTATTPATAPPPPTATATATSQEPDVAAIIPGQRPAAPTATATATAAVTAKPTPTVAGRLPGPLPKPKPTAAEPAAPPPPPVNTCDLACQMKRAVEGKH